MFEGMPNYYKKSLVMKEIMDSIETEFNRLQNETNLTQNQFFVLLSDRDISEHEKDVGLMPDTASDIDTRRGRVLSKLRGTGTVTKAMMKNVAASFVNGAIEVIEYPTEYAFAVKFKSKTGVPYNLSDIQAMIEEIKPAHLNVDYIFTYRLWQDIKDELDTWDTVNEYTWEYLLVYEVPKSVMIRDKGIYFCPDDNGNAKVVWDGNRAYARKEE